MPQDNGHGTRNARGKDGFSATVYFSIWCHDNPGHGTKIMRGKNLFCSELSQCLCIKAWCHETMVTAPKIQGVEGISGKWDILNLVPQDPGHSTKIMRGVPLQVYINIYVCLLTSKSVLQSSTELAHAGYICIVFCVLLIVLCFIMFLLSWDRSLGRCF